MDLGLNGKVVLVTGGSKGIGLACAKAFLHNNWVGAAIFAGIVVTYAASGVWPRW